MLGASPLNTFLGLDRTSKLVLCSTFVGVLTKGAGPNPKKPWRLNADL